MNKSEFINDIPYDIARAAHLGSSFTPERRAEQERDGYAETMVSDYETLLQYTVGKPGAVDVLNVEFARYRQGYREREMKLLHSRSRCMSSMITGPSNFPVRRMEKRNNVAHKRLEEVIEFRKRALDAIRKTLCPELRPIMAGDSDATERLKVKIAEAEKLQAVFKDVNAAIRKHRKDGEAAQIAAVADVFRRSCVNKRDPESYAKELLKPDFAGRIGFATFELTNNNANIKRMKGRLTVIERNQSTESSEHVGESATVEDCPADNRVRLTFPGKPSVEIRTRLKSSGFRWTPSLGVWQAYRHDHTIALAKEIAGIVQPQEAIA